MTFRGQGQRQSVHPETILQLSSRVSRLLGTREMHVLHGAEEDRFVPPVELPVLPSCLSGVEDKDTHQ